MFETAPPRPSPGVPGEGEISDFRFEILGLGVGVRLGDVRTCADEGGVVDDRELLARYVAERSEACFAELVRRNADLVYSAARRQTDAGMAEDITQAAFILLTRKPGSVRGTVAG